MQATEVRLEVQEVLRDKKRMIDSLASFTGRLYVCVCVYGCMYVCMGVYIYVYVYIYI